MPLNMHYNMRFSKKIMTDSRSALAVNISNYEDGRRVLDVAMSLTSRQLNPSSLRSVLMKYPLISWKVFIGIYWQALRLYLKGTPFYKHPKNSRPAPTQVFDRDPTKTEATVEPSASNESEQQFESILVNK